MITELQVVNACLATLGELPLVELQDEHPLVAAARQNMDESIIAEMHRQWWFNTDYCTLTASADKFVYAPADAIAVRVLNRTDLTLRGRRLYDRYNSTYELGGTYRCVVVRDLPFEDLPVTAQLLVQHATVLRFQINYDADDSKTQKQNQLYTRQYALLNAEHTRQISLNGLETVDVATKRMYAGVRPARRGNIPVR